MDNFPYITSCDFTSNIGWYGVDGEDKDHVPCYPFKIDSCVKLGGNKFRLPTYVTSGSYTYYVI